MSAEPSQPFPDLEPEPAARPPEFAAERHRMPDALRVVLAGELDLATAPAADRELREALQEARDVLLDLRGLTFIDAAGLGVVMAAYRRSRRARGRLVVVHEGSACVRRLFELTGADRSLEVIADPAGDLAHQNGRTQPSRRG